MGINEPTRNLSIDEYFLQKYKNGVRSLGFNCKNLEEYESWRQEFMERVYQCLGPFPEPTDPIPETIEIVDEELSVLRLKGHLQDIEDNWIHYNMQISLNNQRMIVALSTDSNPITDLKEDQGDPLADPPVAADPDLVTTKGITTWISDGKLTLRTHEGHMQYGGYPREELIFSE